MANEEKPNIVLFPWMAQGHILPFLALALQLQKKGFSITYVTTPLNIPKLRSLIPAASTAAIRLLEIPFRSSDHGLPPDAESSDYLPFHLVLRLLEAVQHLGPPFRKLLAGIIAAGGGREPVAVVGDFFFSWCADVTHEFNIFHAMFSGAGGFGLACYHSLWLNLPHRNNAVDGEFTLPDFPEAGRLHVSQLSPSLLVANGDDISSRFHRKCLPAWGKSDGFLFNTVEELDNIGLNYFRRQLGIPVWAIGPMLLPVNETERTAKISKTKSGISPEECVEWLNSKPPNSVLYISFGSHTSISASHMVQLAKALDAGETSFIWAIKPPMGYDNAIEFVAEYWLPDGFVQRAKEAKKGLVIEKWAPQLEILSHASVSAFLCHCGWNSVIESLVNGVVLIGWPIAGDQYYNAKLVAEMLGVCVEVARGVDFEVRHVDLREIIELVMGDGAKAKEMRMKAEEVKRLAANNGDSLMAMNEFLKAALLMKEEAEELIKEQGN